MSEKHRIKTGTQIFNAVQELLFNRGVVTISSVQLMIAIENVGSEKELDKLIEVIREGCSGDEEKPVDFFLSTPHYKRTRTVKFANCKYFLMLQEYQNEIPLDRIADEFEYIPSRKTVDSTLEDLEETYWIKKKSLKSKGKTTVWTAGKKVLRYHDLSKIPAKGFKEALFNHTDEMEVISSIKRVLQSTDEEKIEEELGDPIWVDAREKIKNRIEEIESEESYLQMAYKDSFQDRERRDIVRYYHPEITRWFPDKIE